MIIKNAIKCHHCGEIIESKTVHDFRTCSCGKVSVDGGKEYLRRLAATPDDYEEMAECLPDKM